MVTMISRWFNVEYIDTEDAEQEEGHAHGEVVLVTVHRVRTVQRGVGHPQPSSTGRVALSVCTTARNELSANLC